MKYKHYTHYIDDEVVRMRERKFVDSKKILIALSRKETDLVDTASIYISWKPDGGVVFNHKPDAESCPCPNCSSVYDMQKDLHEVHG